MDKGPNLTWIFIGLAVSIFVLTASFTSYNSFLMDNNVSLDSSFASTGENLTEIYNEIDGIGGGLSDKSLLQKIWEGVGGITNVFVMGLSAITEFFRMIGVIDNIFAIIETALPNFNALFGLFTLIITVYISISILKAKRGTSEKA